MKGSKTNFKANMIRHKHHGYSEGLWSIWEMSNRQVMKKFGKESNE